MGSNASNYPKGQPQEAWRLQLSPEQFRVLREAGTERAGTGEYDAHYPSEGVYACAACKQPLYKADMKFKSGCGWPAFFEAIPGSIETHTDRSWGMKRVEVRCAGCGSHQGHVFEGEGFGGKDDQRHCINSVSLKYIPEEKGSK